MPTCDSALSVIKFSAGLRGKELLELKRYESKNMTVSKDDQELINLAAERFGVPADVITALLNLEDSFQNFSVFGAKAEFTRRVNTILDLGSIKAGK